MSRNIKLAAWAIVLIVAAVFAGDWLHAQSRLDRVLIEGHFDRPSVVADGKDEIILTVRVTENGHSRAQDTLQAWLEPGSGLLVPEWSYTDEQGEVQISFKPNPASPYDLDKKAVIHVIDTSIGRLLEVDKVFEIEVPIEFPLTSGS